MSFSPEIQAMDEGFWLISNGDGVVCMCSGEASNFGIVSGVTTVSDIIHVDDRLDLEDALRMIHLGGDVSLTMTPIPETGYGFAHIKSTRLFSQFAAEVRLYVNKNEYLAVSDRIEERIGRVFKHISSLTENIEAMLCETVNADISPNAMNTGFSGILKQLKVLSAEGRLIAEHCGDGARSDAALINAAEIFDLISNRLLSNNDYPFNVEFDDRTDGVYALCRTDVKSFSGIVLMATAVAARLSGKRQCKVSLAADGESVTVESECVLHKEYRLFGRSSDLSGLYRCLLSEPVELIVLENYTNSPGWSTEYTADADGRFVFRAVLVSDTMPERLKFYDYLTGAKGHIDRYLDYLTDVFSSDSQ